MNAHAKAHPHKILHTNLMATKIITSNFHIFSIVTHKLIIKRITAKGVYFTTDLKGS